MPSRVQVDPYPRGAALSLWRILAVVLASSVMIAGGVTPIVGQVAAVTDSGKYTEPALPALPAGGGRFADPVFGTPLMRLTDSSDGSDCRVEYSYWSTFNADSTRVKVLCVVGGVNRTKIWTFDPATFTRGAALPMLPMSLQSSDPIWSYSDPAVIYGHSQSHLLEAYNVTTQATTTVKNFASVAPPGGQLQQMSISANEDRFAFHLTNSSNATTGYVVWQRSTNALLLNQAETNLDEVQIDKSGRYLTVVYKTGNGRIWDLQTMTSIDVTWGVDGFFHHDSGTSTFLSYTGTTSGIGYRSLASPHTVVPLLTLNTANKTAHFSMRANNERWALVSHYNDNGSSVASPFENEIFQVATDGSSQVRRIVHHRSVYNDYSDGPFANISPDGRFVAFSSNWGNANGRRDVFVAYIVAAPTGTSERLTAPSNLRVVVRVP
jgi:hypothetical protein